MASNTFYNIADITSMAMDVLEGNLTFTKYVNRGYDDRFKDDGGKIGDTANIRIPGFGTYRSGATAQPYGYNDTYVPVVLTQGGADLQFTSKELRLNVDDFKQNVLGPQMACVAQEIDRQGAALYTSIYQAAGTPATPPTDLSSFLTAGALLDESLVPRDGLRNAVMNARTQASIVGGLKTLYNPSDDISRQYREGNMGPLAGGFQTWSMDQNFGSHVFGVQSGSPLINDPGGTIVSGATSVPIDTWGGATDVLNKGDIFTIAGVHSVNPITKKSTGQLQQFVVTAKTTASGNAMASVPISPAIITSGPTQNVDALPADEAAVVTLATSGQSSPISMAFHRDAFLLASADLASVGTPGVDSARVKSKRLSNFPIRMVKWYNGQNDTLLYRLDVLFGWTVLRPTFAARVQG